MRLSFVIPAHNEENYIGHCLDSIERELKSSPADVEIIVANNASTDKTREIVARHPNVKIVDEPVMGLARTRRTGFLAATGDLVANVDADTMLTPGWIATVLREFEKNPKLVALSGPFVYYDLPKRTNFWVRVFYYLAFITYVLNRFVFNLGSMLQGGNFVVRRSALEKIGGFNPDIEFYGEDTDIARRIHRAGDVKFTFKLPIYASGRRLAGEGSFTMAMRYGINYFWMIFFGKPFSKTSIVIRPRSGSSQPQRSMRKWAAASGSLAILFIFLVAAGLVVYRLIELGVISTITLTKIKLGAEKVTNKIDTFSNQWMTK